jgi:hypothetical protein
VQVIPDAKNPEGSGVLGLGPVSGSSIFRVLLGQNTGAAVLDRIFLQNLTTPNYLTVNLGRSRGSILVSLFQTFVVIVNRPDRQI